MKALWVVALVLVFCTSSFSMAVPFGRAQNSSNVIVLSPSSATINVGESLILTATVPQDLLNTGYFQWYINGTQVQIPGQNAPSWAFNASTPGVYLITIGDTNSTVMNGRTPNNTTLSDSFLSNPAVITVTTTLSSGTFGYSNSSSQAGGHGDQYVARGSRFTLNVEANVTSISCLIQGNLENQNSDVTYRYAIYDDQSGTVGTLVAQTSQGLFTYINRPIETWDTLTFDKPVSLNAGAYWLMENDNGTDPGNYVMMSDVPGVIGVPFLEADVNNMSFPYNLISPIYTPDYAACIFASYTTGTNALPVNEGTNPTPTQTGVLDTSPQPTQLQASSFTLSCQSKSSTTLAVEVTGTLAIDGVTISGVPVLLSYSINYGTSWIDLTTVITDNNGGFVADWMPQATGTYLLQAIFTGNSQYPPANTTVNFVLAPFQGQTVFSVTSNSTVSAFMFDSSKKQLSFTVSGPSGTRGYTEISIPKTMIDDISSLQVKLDNSQINYNAQSQADSWLVTFNYHHSTHTISVSFDSAKPQLINQFGVYAVIAAVIASAAFIWISRKKSRRGEIRPVFAD